MLQVFSEGVLRTDLHLNLHRVSYNLMVKFLEEFTDLTFIIFIPI